MLVGGLALILVGIWSGVSLAPVRAQPDVAATEPAEGTSLDEPPDAVRVAFDQPVDARLNIAVYDVHGEQVAADRPRARGDDRTFELPLPGELPDGTYTVHWTVDSDAGGESFYSFAINRDTDMLVSSPPESDVGHDPGWLESVGRGLGLLGALLAGGILLTWFLALRPTLHEHEPLHRALGSRLCWLGIAGVAVSLTGAGLALLGESIVAGGSIGVENVEEALTGSDFGLTWLLQVASLAVLSVALSIPALWAASPGWKLPTLALGVGGGVLLSFALSGSAGDEVFGKPASVMVQWLHLVSVGVWSGGLAAVGLALAAIVRTDQRDLVRRVLSRFGVIAAVSLVVMALSGLYGTVLYAGNLAALRQTDYGVTLLIKTGLALALLVLAGTLALWWWRAPGRGSVAVRGVFLLVVLILAGVVIVQAGQLGTSGMTAREEIAFDAERTARSFQADDLDAALHLTPGVAGFNRVTLDLAALKGELDSDSTQAVVRMSPRNGVTGARELLLRPEQICSADGAILETPVDRFEADTTHLSMAGDWDLEVLVNRLDAEDTLITVPMELRAGADEVDVPGPPLRFEGVQANLALLSAVAVVALIALIIVRRRAGESSSFYTLGAAVLLFFTVLALWQGKITHTAESEQRNPIPRTVESVEAGRRVFEAHCVECHGDDATGDGPAATQLDQRPADLTADHVGTHPAGDMATWIRDGIDPAMPGFGEVLNDEEIWHLVNYVRSLSNPVTET